VRNDRCRLRERHGVHLLGAFTRWANRLCIPWRQQQPEGRHLTTTGHVGLLCYFPLKKRLLKVSRIT
jgi:hypothetical protein